MPFDSSSRILVHILSNLISAFACIRAEKSILFLHSFIVIPQNVQSPASLRFIPRPYLHPTSQSIIYRFLLCMHLCLLVGFVPVQLTKLLWKLNIFKLTFFLVLKSRFILRYRHKCYSYFDKRPYLSYNSNPISIIAFLY